VKLSWRRVASLGAALASGVLVPGLVTWAFLGSLVPVAGDAEPGSFAHRFASTVGEVPIPVGAMLFLLVAALASTVRRELARHLEMARSASDATASGKRVEPGEAPAGRTRRSTVFLLTVVSAGLAALLLRSSLFQSYRVLSASMLPALAPGDEIVVDKRAYGLRLPGSSKRFASSIPKRGDVIVFSKTVDGRREELVKRVIGLPGDRITMDGGRAIINGWQVPSCDAGRYFYFPRGGGKPIDGRLAVEFLEDAIFLTALTALAQPFDSYVVKPGELFVLGDNRNESNDSHIWNEGKGGGVPFVDVVGRSTRKLLGTTRAGRVDFGAFLLPIGTHLSLEGVDVKKLETNIRACLAKRPQQTHPPASH
jgi:signal peptidase I